MIQASVLSDTNNEGEGGRHVSFFRAEGALRKVRLTTCNPYGSHEDTGWEGDRIT